MSGSTVVSLLDSYTKSIHQPWKQTPYHKQQRVWKDTMAGVQQLCHVFHELKLKGWPEYLSHIKGRHPKAVIEEVIQWRTTFPHLTAFTRGVVFARVFMGEMPTASPGAQAGARAPQHVPDSHQFPEITLRPPTKLHKTKYLERITTQLANQLFEEYTESIDQDWRNTPIHHRNKVWGDTFETLQRLFLQFHELRHPTWTDFHAHTAG
jgi:hypothetical protein